jgi:hypothetical protein
MLRSGVARTPISLAGNGEEQRKRLFHIVDNVPGIVWEASLDPDSGNPTLAPLAKPSAPSPD